MADICRYGKVDDENCSAIIQRRKHTGKELQSSIYAFDSTTISLCLKLFPWATYSSKRKAIKVHVLMNTDGYIPEFVHVTTGNRQDMLVMDQLSYKAGCFYVVDKAYVDYERLYRIELSKAFFVTRAKGNMSFTVKKNKPVDVEQGVLKDELVKMKRWHTRRWYPAEIRRIEYKDTATGLFLVFLTSVCFGNYRQLIPNLSL